MRNEENDCIRYLMKEMDPSEELLMERAMMEDEDLLIEVESMRQTLQKLDKLPDVEPPSYVVDSVMEEAAEHAREKRASRTSFSNTFKYAVAATLALTITAGGAWLFVGTEGENSQQQQATVASTSSPAPSSSQASERSATLQFSENDIQNVTVSQTPKVDPWVDRNNILRFEDQFSNQNEQFRAIMKRSTQKLQLIEDPSVSGGRVNSIQLTGSNN